MKSLTPSLTPGATLNAMCHIITQTIYRVFARYCMLIQCVPEPSVGADYSPPVEGWQAEPDGVVVACLHKAMRHQTNLTACAIQFMKMVGSDLHIRPKVPFCTNRTATRHQIMVTVNEMDRMGLLKKYRHCMNPTACAIEFKKTVGSDLHIRPKVESSHKENRRLSQ